MNFEALKQGRAVPLTEHLTLTLIRESDMAEVIAMLNDERVSQYLYFAPADESVFRGFFEPIIENTRVAIDAQQWPDNPTFVIRDTQGRYMGMTALTSVMFLPGNFEVGYQLPFHAWGHGIATVACHAMLQLAFEQLAAHKVSADCYASNVGSYKTMQKCGMVREGQQSDYYKLAQGFDDRVFYGISLQQYQAQ